MTGGDPGDGRRLYTVGEIDEAIRRTSCDIDLTVEDVILILLRADPRPVQGLPALVRQVFLALTTVLAGCRVEPVSFCGTASGPRSGHVEGDAEQLLFSRNIEIAGGGEGPGAEIAITPRGRDRIRKAYEALPAGTRSELSRKRAEWAESAPAAIRGDVCVRGGRVAEADRPGKGTSAFKWDVFISYAHKDGEEVAAKLEAGLVHRDLRVWRDVARLSIGDKVSSTIMGALERSAYAVTIVSPAYDKSRYAMIELGKMLGGRLEDRIIPILYKTSHSKVAPKLPMLADTFMRYWDKGDPESIMNEIARVVKDAREGGQEPAADTGRDATDRDLMGMAGRGAAESIFSRIGEKTVIDRSKEIGEIKELLEDKGRVAIVGDRGSGKSVLSRLLYEDLAASEAALLVRCDDFLGIESAEELDRAVVHGRSLVDIVSRAAPPGGVREMTIIFDSLDAAGRNEKTMRAFKLLFGMVWGAGARTVVTVRSYDYGNSPLLGTTDWGSRYDLGPLPGAEIDRILGEIGSPPVPPGLKELLAVPLNLHILSLVLERSTGADLASIRSEIDLYDTHWHHYVELDPLKIRVKDELYGMAEAMFKVRKTTIPYGPDDQEAAEAAQSSNMLERTGGGGMIRYFHHAYLDYVMSRALLERHQSLTDYLHADEHNIFLLPTLSLTFAMAHERDAKGFATLVEEIARADIRHYWKNAAIAALAAVLHDEKCAACLRLETLLADHFILQRHFLIALAKQPSESWFPVWGGALAGWATDADNHNGSFIVDCLKVAAADARHHNGVFAVARELAKSNKNGQARKEAVVLLADIDATGKAELLRAMSRDGDPRVRSGVAHNLPRLLDSNPDAVPVVFCNLYSHEETSSEKTSMGSYGAVELTSTKAQDNLYNKWDLCTMLPGLLKANPTVMVRAVILAAERINHDILERQGNGLANDPLWRYRQMAPSDGEDPLSHVRNYIDGCSDEDLSCLIPAFKNTRLVSFRRMLVDAVAIRTPRLADDLAVLLSDPHVYESHALQRSVRDAIGSAVGMLDEAQAKRICNAIARSNSPRDLTGAEMRKTAQARAAFFSELPRAVLSTEHASIVDQFPKQTTTDVPPPSVTLYDLPDEKAAEHDPLAAVRAVIGDDLGRDKKIKLLQNMAKVLGGPHGGLEETLLLQMEALLLRSKHDEDPEQDAENPPEVAREVVPNVRGLVAECLIRISAERKSGDVLEAIRELSEDPVNLVRSDVARSLRLLSPDHYDMARTIALAYSRDPDPHVRFYLPAFLPHMIPKEPASASAMIGNILVASTPAPMGIAAPLLRLAICLEEPHATRLLDRIVDKREFDDQLRIDISFVLKKDYIRSWKHSDAALDLLYRLLGDSSSNVRRKVVFLTLSDFDENPDIDDRKYIKKITRHLSRMMLLLDEKPLDIFIADALTKFLDKFWAEVPEFALACLDKIIKIHGGTAASEPAMADRSLKILGGLLSHHSLYDDEWNRCIDVLDAFAAVGWPAALDLLAEMGRRD